MSRTVAQLVADLEARLRPVTVALEEAWWAASTHSSSDAERRRAELDLERRAILADPDAFAEIRAARRLDSSNPVVARQLDVLHDAFLPNQVPEDLRRELVGLETSVESDFTTFRGTIDGERVDDNMILEVLRTSDDAQERRAAWESSKQVGAEVADRVRSLARRRNQAAVALGYRDHFALALATGEMDETRLLSTLAEVERVTTEPFTSWKQALDEQLAVRFACSREELMPWHLDDPFFQEPPIRGAVDLDPIFEGVDIEDMTMHTFDGLGIDLRAVLEHSDLYARDGKSQHAFCVDIDREGDVRVLCNLEPNERSMETTLHEFGHAAYDRGVDHALPWLLRGPAHALTTEGVAMLCGRLVRDPEWLAAVRRLDTDKLADLGPQLAEARRAALLVFARWVLVVTHFERRLYAEPDGDLDTLWWALVERYQQVRRPDGRHTPDWASKIHLAVVPVYYQNYLYGELVASQLAATISARCGGLVDRPEAGRFLVEQVFLPGASRRWDHLLEDATGAPLSATQLGRDLAA